MQGFLGEFDYREPLARVELDLSAAHLWDGSAVAALDKVVLKYRARGVTVHVTGLNEASASLVERLGTQQRADATTGIVSGDH